MSKATKRKHVTREVEEDLILPEPDQTIVKVVAGRGNNLHEVTNHSGQSFLVSMPTKFRKNVWIKRGDFVIVTPIEEGDKVKAEITTILYKHQIKHIKSENLWPTGFQSQAEEEVGDLSKLSIKDKEADSEEDDSEEDDSDLFVNTNRPVQEVSEESEETTETDTDEE